MQNQIMKPSRSMSKKTFLFAVLTLGILSIVGWLSAQTIVGPPSPNPNMPIITGDATVNNGAQMIVQGRQIFRYDTYGDEGFWGGTLGLHLALEGTNFGGVGPGVGPRTALQLGLKVDADALPAQLVQQLKR